MSSLYSTFWRRIETGFTYSLMVLDAGMVDLLIWKDGRRRKKFQ